MGNLYSSNKNRESVDIKKYDFSLNLEDFVVPFTDEKLAEFYFNSELQETKNCFDTTLYELNEKLNEDDYFYKLLVS